MSSVTLDETLSLEELTNWVSDWSSSLTFPHLVLLNGSLGSGKTALTQSLVNSLGGGGVSSPTYSLIQSYAFKGGEIFHVDLYRLDDPEELDSVGFWDLFSEKNSLVIVEWAERVPKTQWPLHWKRTEITISKTGDDQERHYHVIEEP